MEIEMAVENKVMSDIIKRQKNIPNLKQDNLNYLNYWSHGDLTPGCKDCCLKGRSVSIRTTSKCQLNCPFCYYFGKKDFSHKEEIPSEGFSLGQRSRVFRLEDIELFFENKGP